MGDMYGVHTDNFGPKWNFDFLTFVKYKFAVLYNVFY
jgi:hypothetical protein